MATAFITKRYTPEEYLTLERKAEFKNEYCNGFITAMSGASRKHNLVAGNIHAVTWNQLVKHECEVYMGRHAQCGRARPGYTPIRMSLPYAVSPSPSTKKSTRCSIRP